MIIVLRAVDASPIERAGGGGGYYTPGIGRRRGGGGVAACVRQTRVQNVNKRAPAVAMLISIYVNLYVHLYLYAYMHICFINRPSL